MSPDLVRYAESVLGPCTVIGDSSWAHWLSTVTQVRDAAGTDWFVKRALCGPWRVGPAGLALQPGWCRPGRGHPVSGRTAAAMPARRGAPVSWPGFADAKCEELERWAATATGLLEPDELAFVRARAGDLATLDPPATVPCHMDYSPRNWLVSEGKLYVIDFEWSRRDAWANDLMWLYFGPWRARPGLEEAFLDGYGRQISDTDREILLRCGAITAVWLVVRAHEYGDSGFEEASRRNLQRLMAADGDR